MALRVSPGTGWGLLHPRVGAQPHTGVRTVPLLSVGMTVIEVNGLTKRYGDRTVVDGVSFTVAEGEIFGILGENGAGKTTTVECISGLRTPDSGTISVLGMDAHTDREQLRRLIGVQLQESQLQDRLRVGEAMQLYASFYPDPADWRELVAAVGLNEQVRMPYAKLSGGQKQRLSIALALIGNPRVAILDELTTGLDPRARRETWKLIRQIRDRGVTVLLVTHFMDEAERLCDRLAVLDGGRIVALDTPAALIAGVGDVDGYRANLEDAFLALTGSDRDN